MATDPTIPEGSAVCRNCGHRKPFREFSTQPNGYRHVQCKVCRRTAKCRSRSPEYKAWDNAKRRCEQPHDASYRNYGGRGITMCDRWRTSFEAFLVDMGPRPHGTTLDRVNNDGPYAPDNCRWGNWFIQGNNRRTNRRITVGTETRNLVEWARSLGTIAQVIGARLDSGLDPTVAMSKPVRQRRQWSPQLNVQAQAAGIDVTTVHHRLGRGWSLHCALTTPTQKRSTQPRVPRGTADSADQPARA